MAERIKVSVVVPVYNTATYLRECLDSLLGQTLQEIEIICVDDGSTDESPDILEEYSAADSRVTVLRQQNQYAGVARNRGMGSASGEYIMFCDSDDYMAKDALELMYIQCEKDSADLCVCGGERYYEQLNMTVAAPGYLQMKRVPNVLPFNRHTNEDHIFSFTTVMMFNKMFRLSFLRENNLEYGTTRNGEDVYICAMSLWLARAITVVNKPLVFYRIDRPDSLVGTLSQSAVDPLRAWMQVWDRIGADLGLSKRSFICKVVGVMLHCFRNVSTVDSFDACFGYIRNNMAKQLDLREQPEGYYYSSWCNEFVIKLMSFDSREFMAYMLYFTARDWETERAKKLHYRRKLKREKARAAKAQRLLDDIRGSGEASRSIGSNTEKSKGTEGARGKRFKLPRMLRRDR